MESAQKNKHDTHVISSRSGSTISGEKNNLNFSMSRRPALTLLHDGPLEDDKISVNTNTKNESDQPVCIDPIKTTITETIVEQPPPAYQCNNTLKHIEKRLLFRPVLPQPSTMHHDPWFECPEDAVLTQLWDPDHSLSLKPDIQLLCDAPSTISILHQLLQTQKEHTVHEERRYHSMEQDKLIIQTRGILERHNLLRDIEDIKAREEALCNLKLSLTSRSILRLAGIELSHAPLDIRFPTSNKINTKHRRKIQKTWSCSILTYDDTRNALMQLNPPLFNLLTHNNKNLPNHFLRDVPVLNISYTVIEHIALVVELQIKHAFFSLIRQYNSSSVDANNKKILGLPEIELLICSGGFQNLLWDTRTILAQLKTKYLKLEIMKSTHLANATLMKNDPKKDSI